MDSDKQWPLESFNDSVDVSDLRREWEEWFRAFELVLETKNVYAQHDKLVLLLSRGGRGLQRIYYNLRPVPDEIHPAPAVIPFAPKEIPEYDNAIKRLNAFFVGKRNERVELEEFCSLKQRTGESFKQFVLRLRAQAARCEFYDREEKEILHQVTMGTSDERVRDKGLENVMNLDELSNYALNRELMLKQKAKSHPFGSEPSTSLAYVKQESSVGGRAGSYGGAGRRDEPYRGPGGRNELYRAAGGRNEPYRGAGGRNVPYRGAEGRSGERTSRFATSAAVVVRGVTAVILVSVMHVVRSATSVALLVTMNGCVRRPNSRYEKAAEVVQPNPIHGNARLKRMLCERRTIPSRNCSVTATRTARSRYDKPYLIVKRARRIGGLMV